MKRRRIILWAGTSAMVLSASLGLAAEPTIDELLHITPKPDQPKAVEPAPKPDAGVPIDPEVQRMLSGVEAEGALKRAVQEMDEAAARLGQKFDAGPQTQRLQEGILKKLEMVIESARSQQGSGSGKPKPNQAQPQDTGSGGNEPSGGQQAGAGNRGENRGEITNPKSPPGGDNAGRLLREERREWGNLPPRVRDELLQSLNERFSPIYKTMTEAYYRRLAEEGNK